MMVLLMDEGPPPDDDVIRFEVKKGSLKFSTPLVKEKSEIFDAAPHQPGAKQKPVIKRRCFGCLKRESRCLTVSEQNTEALISPASDVRAITQPSPHYCVKDASCEHRTSYRNQRQSLNQSFLNSCDL